MGQDRELDEAFRRFSIGQIAHRFRWGVGAAIAFGVALLVLGEMGSNPEVASALRRPVGTATACLVAAAILASDRLLGRRPLLVVAPLGFAVSVCSGWAASISGNFGSPYLYVVLLIWIFVAAILPLSARSFVVVTASNAPIAFGIVAVHGTSWGSAPLVGTIFGGAYLYCVVACALRHSADRAAFDVRAQLAERERVLRDLNGNLERRVDEQVREIVQRAAQVDALNAQLQIRVKERSRELALALDRIAGAQPPASDDLPIGARFADRASVVKRLGAGGMGVVYLARDLATGSDIALKVIRKSVAGRQVLQRFLLEAGAAASISHPAIARTLHVDVTEDGQAYMILEYIPGVPLDRYLERAALGVGGAARVCAAVGMAIEAAHSSAVVHRDVKPSNVVLTPMSPGIKLLDFGLAKLLLDSVSGTATEASQVVGTPAFMAPEQRIGGEIGPAVDVYSLALVFVLAATGATPDGARAAQAIDRLDLLPGEREMLARCLAVAPEARPDATALAAQLTQIADRLGAPELARIAEAATRPNAAALADTHAG